AACSALGLGSTLFAEALWGVAQTTVPEPKPEQPGAPKPGAAASAEAANPDSAELPPKTKITPEMITAAAAIAGLRFPPDQIQMMADNLNSALGSYRQIWALKIPNDVPPALLFDPVLSGQKFETERRPMRLSRIA